MKLGIILNGVTGRMGTNQHLVRSILAIRQPVRVYRDDLFTLQVGGTEGRAVAGLRDCSVQHRATTPRPIWNRDVPREFDYPAGWQRVPDNEVFGNAFKVQWELFLKHVACNEPFPWTLLEGAKGVQLAEPGLRSWRERRWLDVAEVG